MIIKGKRLDEVLCATVGLATGSSYALAYAGGRQGTWFFPVALLPDLIGMLCLALLFVSVLIALAKRKPAGKKSILLAVAFLLFASDFAVSPARLFQAGFRDKIKTTLSPDELRKIARLCHEKMPPDSELHGPRQWETGSESEPNPLWNALVAQSSLGKLDQSLRIRNHTDTVEICWGGALVGHWGLIIRTDGKPQAGDIADGITTFISAD